MSSAEAVVPRYFGGALSDVLPSALAAAGARGWANSLGLPSSESYVVFLVDGLGWNQLLAHPDEAPYLFSLAVGATPITCGVPSTTATSITSLGTGLPPGAHGVVGFTSRIPGTDRLLDALRWDSRVDPREWQVHDTVFARAAADGIATTSVSKRIFETSGLTLASQRGAAFVGADSLGERISAVVRASGEIGSLTYVYEGELDATGHRRGSRSWAWDHQLAMVDTFARRLREALPERVGLVVTADHGMVDVTPEGRLDVDGTPGMLDSVSLLGGEARFRHLYCTSGSVVDVAARWRELLGHNAWVVSRDEAIDEGWFGDVDALVRPRLGDVMVASRGDSAIVSSTRFPHEARLIGLHGSLSADEMLVPLLVDVW
ncbi:MAG: alkaline phosphatase family protein [Propionibacteriales bacterium]|nr:alkaline phosphatase family protein [Propionibacteriales bacterium]